MKLTLKTENEILYKYLIIQVLSDLITTFIVREINSPISVSTLFRGGFFIYTVILILLKGNKKEQSISILTLLFLGLHIVFQAKRFNYPLTYHLMSVVKVFGYPFFILYFASLFRRNKEVKNQQFPIRVSRCVLLSTISYSFIIVVMALLGIGIKSYPGNIDLRIGSIGYFLAANEMGPFLITLTAISAYSVMKKDSYLGKAALLSGFFALSTVGTKSALIGSLAILTLFTIYNLIQVFRTKKLKINLILVLVMMISVPLLPSYKNLSLHKAQLSERQYQESLEKGDPVRESVQIKHDAAPIVEVEDFLKSINLILSEDVVFVSGYLYPKYEDIGHPNFVSYKIHFKDNTDQEVGFELKPIYNPHIENDKEDIYSSAFSGYEGKLDYDAVKELGEVEIFIEQIVDESRVYKVSLGLQDFEDLVDINLIGSEIEGINTEQSSISGLINKILSGRSSRVSKYLNNYGPLSTTDLLLGTGQLRYGVVGFEMDPIEVFIIYGGLGFALYFGLTLYLLFATFIDLIKKSGKSLIKYYPEWTMLIMMALISMIGFLSGHTFIAPRVAIVLALGLNLMFSVTKGEKYE